MYRHKLVFAAACLGMLIFGIVMTTLGAILPSLISRFAIDMIDAGSLLMLMSFGMLAGSVVFGPVVDRFGYQGMLVLCTAVIILGLEGLAFSSSLLILRLVVFLIGFGGGVINGGTNALVSVISIESKSANLSLLGVFFGIGAFGVPLLLGALLRYLSYAAIIALVGAVVVIPLGFFLAIRFPAPQHKEGLPIRAAGKLVRDATLLLIGLVLFFESGLEMTAGGWTATYFSTEMTVSPERAVFILSLYWMGQMLARIVLGRILKTVSPALVFRVCLATAAGGAFLLILSSALPVSILGIFLLGVGFAAGFPVMLGYVGELYPRITGTAFSLVFVMALLGGMSWPYLTGILSHYFGFRISFLLVPVSLGCMLLLFQWIRTRITVSPAS